MQVSDQACVEFLQWALPRLKPRWPGFRGVRNQVRKKLSRRLVELDLPDLEAYWVWLDAHLDEWVWLDAACRITISRVYRDRMVWTVLEEQVLPALARLAGMSPERELRCWSAGCASGEEPHTLVLLWTRQVAKAFPDVRLRMVASDADEHLVERARQGVYPAGNLRELPAWREGCFDETSEGLRLRDEFRGCTEFEVRDIRQSMPEGRFHLVLCRNMALTYFDERLQREVVDAISAKLHVIGLHESLLDHSPGLVPWVPPVFRRVTVGESLG